MCKQCGYFSEKPAPTSVQPTKPKIDHLVKDLPWIVLNSLSAPEQEERWRGWGGPSWNRSSININETLSMQQSDVHRDSRVTISPLLLRATASTSLLQELPCRALTRPKEGEGPAEKIWERGPPARTRRTLSPDAGGREFPHSLSHGHTVTRPEGSFPKVH